MPALAFGLVVGTVGIGVEDVRAADVPLGPEERVELRPVVGEDREGLLRVFPELGEDVRDLPKDGLCPVLLVVDESDLEVHVDNHQRENVYAEFQSPCLKRKNHLTPEALWATMVR